MQERESLLTFLISKRTFALSIAMVLFVCFSVLSWLKIPLEVMPKENVPPFLYVSVDAQVASTPEKTELFLTLPVEGALRTIPNVTGLASQTQGRSASFSLTLKPKTNLDLATIQIQEALQDLETQGLLDMKSVAISRLNPEATPVTKIAVTYGANVSYPNQRIQTELREALEAIPEISKIEISGLDPTVFEFTIPINKAQDAGVQISNLSSALSFSPIRESVGSVARANQSLPVQARLVVDDLETVKRVNLGHDALTPLADIGEERRIDKASSEISHNNGQHAVFIEIYAKDSANLFKMTESLETAIRKFQDLKFEFVFNKTNDLKSALDDVLASLYEAIVITFIVVFFFLRSGRQTALICITIPITLLATVLVIYATGGSLNILTLSGLILGIGMVVDNAVLVTGTIDELRSKYGVKEAAAKGASRIFMALLMSTITNAIIFLPVSFLEGGDSFTDILKAFQLPIVGSLVCSLIVAMLLLPLLIIFWPGSPPPPSAPLGIKSTPSGVKVFFRGIQQYRLPIALAAFLLVAIIGESALQIEQRDIDSPKDPYTTINVKFSPEMDSVDRRNYFEIVEKNLLSLKSEIGFRFVVSDFNPKMTSGTLLVYPEPTKDIDSVLMAQDKRLNKFILTLPKKAGAHTQIGWETAANTSASSRAPEVLSIAGPRTLKIQALLADLKQELTGIAGVESVRLDREEFGETNLVFVPDDAIVARHGLTLPQISSEISASMTSVSVSGLKYNGQPAAAKIILGPSTGTWTLDAIKNLRIAVGEKGQMTLAELGSFTTLKVLKNISRKEGVATGKIYVDLKASLEGGALDKARSAVQNAFEFFDFPKGYGKPKSDSLERLQAMQSKSGFIIYLSIVLIYLVLASLFESILIPFAILISVPMALLFGVAGLLVMGMSLDVMARLSLVILVGIAVNNAIILIDLILELKAQGLRRSEAIVEGCSRRLKAVLMTTSIQVIGVLPVALGRSKIMGIPYASLGVCIISGMLFSTILTLVILPIVYEFLDDVDTKLKGFASSLRS